jgi:hypothetical protein
MVSTTWRCVTLASTSSHSHSAHKIAAPCHRFRSRACLVPAHRSRRDFGAGGAGPGWVRLHSVARVKDEALAGGQDHRRRTSS